MSDIVVKNKREKQVSKRVATSIIVEETPKIEETKTKVRVSTTTNTAPIIEEIPSEPIEETKTKVVVSNSTIETLADNYGIEEEIEEESNDLFGLLNKTISYQGSAEYTGIDTETIDITVDNVDKTIKADVKTNVIATRQYVDNKLVVDYIELYASEGTLTSEQREKIRTNNLNQLFFVPLKSYFKLGMRDGANRKYYAIQNDAYYRTQYFDVNIDTGAYVYNTVEDDRINAHISDTSVHIQSGERMFWNNKLNMSMDEQNENLVFNRL